MKTLLSTSFLFLILSLSAFSQNWQIVNPNYAYHYVESANENDSLNALTIRVESTHSDTSELNRLVQFEKDVNGYAKGKANQSFFLQKQMIDQPNSKKWFVNPGSFILFESSIPQSWLFDTIEGIQAQINSVYETQTYGQSDSIRSISLSSGDVILQSKSFGILSFPKEYGTGEFYKQIGVKGPNVGFQFPEAETFYNFSIGDKFEIRKKERNDSQSGQSSDHEVEKEVIQHLEVIEIRELASGIKEYTFQINSVTKSKTYNYWIGQFTDSSITYSENTEKKISLESNPFPIWRNDNKSIWDIFPSELFIYGNYGSYGPISSVEYENVDLCGERITRSLDLFSCITYTPVVENKESFIDFDCVRGSNSEDWSGAITWTEGLGVTSLQMSTFNSGGSSSDYSETLTTFRKDGVTCGKFASLKIFEEKKNTGTSNPEHPYLHPFVNPVKDKINVYPNPNLELTRINIADISGRVVLSQEFRSREVQSLELPEHLQGLYIVSFFSRKDEKLAWYKMIIE